MADVETGGVLFGAHTPDDELVVFHATGPGGDADHRAAEFAPDIEHAQAVLQSIRREWDVVWIGTWHTHPGGMNRLSSGDIAQMREFVEDPGLPDEILAIIITTDTDPDGVQLNPFYMDESLQPTEAELRDVPEGRLNQFRSYCQYDDDAGIEGSELSGEGADVGPTKEAGGGEALDDGHANEAADGVATDGHVEPCKNVDTVDDTAESTQAAEPDPDRSTDSRASVKSGESQSQGANRPKTGSRDGSEGRPVSDRRSSESTGATPETTDCEGQQGPDTVSERVLREYRRLKNDNRVDEVTLQRTDAGDTAIRVVPRNSAPVAFVCTDVFPDEAPVVARERHEGYDILDTVPRAWDPEDPFAEILSTVLDG
jgi:hypothetical protein